MTLALRKLIFIFIFNLSLFLILILGIQNSSKRAKVNFLVLETISLPISFIIGISYISGSIFSGFLTINSDNKN